MKCVTVWRAVGVEGLKGGTVFPMVKKTVKNLFQLKKSHYRNFLAHMEATGVSVGYLIHVETNLRLLAKGMDRVSESKGFEKAGLGAQQTSGESGHS
jgi:hypothetical protein